MTVIGNNKELFFNKESKSGTWEITYNSNTGIVLLDYYLENVNEPEIGIKMSKKEFLELKKFIKNIRLTKNYKMNIDWSKLDTITDADLNKIK